MTDGQPSDPRDLPDPSRDHWLTEHHAEGWSPEWQLAAERAPAAAAVERIAAHRGKLPGAGAGVRRLAAAWCPTGPKLVAGVYVVDRDVWLWLDGTRRAPAHSRTGLREQTGPRAVWIRDVADPHPPGCNCEPLGDQWATCRCCKADRRIGYRCTDQISARPFPRTHNAR